MTSSPGAPDSDDDALSDSVEMQQHAFYILRALQCVDAGDKMGLRQALVEGLLNFGFRFTRSIHGVAKHLEGQQIPIAELDAEMGNIIARWMLGEHLTDRLDESERRAQLAKELLESGLEGADRLAARCLLMLPEGHPQRDTALAREALLRYLEHCRLRGDVDNQLRTMYDLLCFNLESHERTLELIGEGHALVGRATDEHYQLQFPLQALCYYIELAFAARREGRGDEHRKWSGEMLEIYEEIRAEHPDYFEDAKGLALAAAVMEISGRQSDAAALFASSVDASAPSDDVYWAAATTDARYRMKSGEYERVVKILTPAVPPLEAQYLTAVEDRNLVPVSVTPKTPLPSVRAAGRTFSQVSRLLAAAHAHLNQWDEAIQCLERSKSLRLRYRAALRRTPEGQRLLEIESKLYALGRGVPVSPGEFDRQRAEDWLGAKVSLRSKVLEAYRTQRPHLPPELLTAPAVADIARSLGAGEAVVVLGVVEDYGTLVAVICRGDVGQPSGHFLLEDWPFHRWAGVFGGEQQDGWLHALFIPELKLDHRPPLLHLLNVADEVIGHPLRSLLRERGVRRITVIPHLWFHLLPFWALPSLEDYDVMIAASTAHFVQARRAAEPAAGRALIIADPTRDLPASLAEADAVAHSLSRLDFDVTRLDREQATENAVVASLPGVSVFHFCGHGRSDVVNPERSALLVSPGSDFLSAGVPDLLGHFAEGVEDWQDEGGGWRSAALPTDGRLYERLTAEGQVSERRFEYGERGSLWGRYLGGRLAQLAEMWTAGDILIDRPLGDCRLAFLSACEAGSGSIDAEVDEYSGLPASLQLAGVATVVCSLWPVGDELTALYVDLFYQTLAAAPQPADVDKVVRKVGRRLRRMKRERAVALLNKLRRQTSSPFARFRLEAFAASVAAGEPYPFAHPYDWAAFYATGASRIQFRQGDTS